MTRLRSEVGNASSTARLMDAMQLLITSRPGIAKKHDNVSSLHTAAHVLRGLGIDVATHVSAGLGRSVDPVGLRLGAEFVGRVLNRPVSA